MPDKARQVSRIAAASVGVGIALTAMKLAVGLATGSLGILSEAAHSLLDLGAALITFFAVRAAARPADREHLYGHGKLENLSALAEALLLLATCVWIVYEAVQRLTGKPHEIDASAWAFVVMGTSLVLDVVISRVLYAGARKHNSQALEADALHYSSDILSSGVVLAGLVGVRLGQPLLDPLAALGVALLVTIASVRLSRKAIDQLLDRAPAGLPERIEQRIRQKCLVDRVERVRVRPSGSTTFVDLIVSVRRGMTLEQSHELADCLDLEVKQVVPECDVLVHFHPTSTGETVIDAVRAVAARFSAIDDVHNIRSYEEGGDGKHFVTAHVKLAAGLSLEEAHRLVDEFEKTLRGEMPQIGDMATHIEARDTVVEGRRRPIPPERIAALSRAVLRDPRVRGIHEIVLHTSSAGIVLTCHIETGRDLTLEEAHAATTGVEAAARKVFPEIDDVVVHAEPEATATGSA
jgi:cation diffusion facilitator family transporter